jgi:molybdopterin-guanine dinucleotide biosynthesis protein A
VNMINRSYILAGGQSQRLGQDKLFVDCDGTSLLGRTIQTCRSLFPEVKLVAKRADKLEKLGCEVVLDWPQADGPLAGVVAALEDCSQESCFVTAADLYDLDSEIVERLIESYNGEQYFGLQEAGGGQPLCGIYHRSALTHLVSCGQAGVWRMKEIVSGLDHGMLPIDRGQWRNINIPSDLDSIGASNG